MMTIEPAPKLEGAIAYDPRDIALLTERCEGDRCFNDWLRRIWRTRECRMIIMQSHVMGDKSLKFDSPIEEAFAWTWADKWEQILAYQYRVHLSDYEVHLDFAHVPTKLGIELDGFTYHGSSRAFERDRQRDRQLTGAGWNILRFAATEIQQDCTGCCQQVREEIERRYQEIERAVTLLGAMGVLD